MGRLKVGNASAESRLFLMGAGFTVLLALAVGVAASSSPDPLEQHEAVWSESLDLSARGLTDDELRDVVDSAEFSSVEYLDLSRNHVTSRALEIIASSPNARNLRALDLSGNQLGRDFSAPTSHLPTLRRLDLSQSGLDFEHIPQLADWSTFAKLDHVNLSGNALGDVGLVELTRRERLWLTSLDVSNNDIGPRGARALGVARWAPRLITLAIDGNPLGDDGVSAMMSGNLHALSELSISNTALGGEALGALSSVPKLQRLDISKNSITRSLLVEFLMGNLAMRMIELDLSGAIRGGYGPVFSARMTFPFLEVLILDDNLLSDEDIQRLAQVDMPELETLSLRAPNKLSDFQRDRMLNVGVGDQWSGDPARKLSRRLADAVHANTAPFGEGAFADLMSSKLLGSLERLDVSGYDVGDSGLRAISSSKHAETLESLGLANTRITGGAGETLARMRSLESLDLSFNDRLEISLLDLVSIEVLSRLTKLELNQTPIGLEGAQALAAHGAALEVLDLRYTDIGGEGVRALERAAWSKNLRGFKLSGDGLGDEVLLSLLESGFLDAVTDIDLSDSGLSDASVARLYERGGVSLTHVSLADNNITGASVDTWRARSASSRLRGLDVSGTLISPSALSRFCVERNPTLDYMVIGGYGNTDIVVSQLARDGGLWNVEQLHVDSSFDVRRAISALESPRVHQNLHVVNGDGVQFASRARALRLARASFVPERGSGAPVDRDYVEFLLYEHQRDRARFVSDLVPIIEARGELLFSLSMDRPIARMDDGFRVSSGFIEDLPSNVSIAAYGWDWRSEIVTGFRDPEYASRLASVLVLEHPNALFPPPDLDDVAARILADVELSHVNELVLCGYTSSQHLAVLGERLLPELRRLVICGGPFDDEVFEALLKGEALRHLDVLDLTGVKLTASQRSLIGEWNNEATGAQILTSM